MTTTNSAVPPGDLLIAAEIAQREISEVLHFTTSRGAVGILAQRKLQARTHLSQDKYLEHIYQPNSQFRREAPEYWRYVNLSISEVNEQFFAISRRWHASDPYLHWVVLAFDPQILTHPGVLFAPGNMAYDGMVAEAGSAAFSSQFDDWVPYGYGRSTQRPETAHPAQCTNPQAEALYPDAVSTTHLRTIYVANADDAANVEGILGTLDHGPVEVIVNPDMFGQT